MLSLLPLCVLISESVMSGETAVTADFACKQLLLFAFALCCLHQADPVPSPPEPYINSRRTCRRQKRFGKPACNDRQIKPWAQPASLPHLLSSLSFRTSSQFCPILSSRVFQFSYPVNRVIALFGCLHWYVLCLKIKQINWRMRARAPHIRNICYFKNNRISFKNSRVKDYIIHVSGNT